MGQEGARRGEEGGRAGSLVWTMAPDCCSRRQIVSRRLLRMTHLQPLSSAGLSLPPPPPRLAPPHLHSPHLGLTCCRPASRRRPYDCPLMDQHMCILCRQVLTSLERYVQHRASGACRRPHSVSPPDPAPDLEADQECDADATESERSTGLFPPPGHRGGKWRPGHDPTDLYRGYRILDGGEERSSSGNILTAALPSLDPVADKIRSIRLSLSSGIFDPVSLVQEQRRCLQEFPFVCRVCPFYSSQMSSFAFHLNSVHHRHQVQQQDAIMMCKICSFSCRRMADLIRHFNLERKRKTDQGGRCAARGMQDEYAKGTIFSCEVRKPVSCPSPDCDRRFRLRISARIHFRKQHRSKLAPARVQQPAAASRPPPPPTTPASTNQDRFNCPLCSSRLTTAGECDPSLPLTA